MEKSIRSREYAVFLRLLRQARKRAGLTQTELAQAIRGTQSLVGKVERGERRLDIIELRVICEACGCSLKQFVAELEKALSKRK